MRTFVSDITGFAGDVAYEETPGDYPMKKRILMLLAILAWVPGAILTAGPRAVSAQTGGGYDLTWNSIDGGGATFSTGGGYSLGATVGQADAGAASGGVYTLSGGFWAGIPANYNAFVPIAMR